MRDVAVDIGLFGFADAGWDMEALRQAQRTGIKIKKIVARKAEDADQFMTVIDEALNRVQHKIISEINELHAA